MADYRQAKNKHFKQPRDERGNPHGGHGRRAERNLAEQFETQTGHPLGSQKGALPGGRLAGDLPRDTDLTHDQHARKGQAQSPREVTLNQPEKKKKRGGRG
jgi:hypothetical protein